MAARLATEEKNRELLGIEQHATNVASIYASAKMMTWQRMEETRNTGVDVGNII